MSCPSGGVGKYEKLHFVLLHIINYYYLVVIILVGFYHQFSSAVFLWNWSKSKSSKVSRTLQNFPADLIDLILLRVSRSSCVIFRTLKTVPRTPANIGITITFMVHNFPDLWKDPIICLSFRFLLFFFFFFFFFFFAFVFIFGRCFSFFFVFINLWSAEMAK